MTDTPEPLPILEFPSENQLGQSHLTVNEQDMIALFQRFITLQDQFGQLTNYMEKAFQRITELEKVVANKVLS